MSKKLPGLFPRGRFLTKSQRGVPLRQTSKIEAGQGSMVTLRSINTLGRIKSSKGELLLHGARTAEWANPVINREDESLGRAEELFLVKFQLRR